jgi:hypothetical protein
MDVTCVFLYSGDSYFCLTHKEQLCAACVLYRQRSCFVLYAQPEMCRSLLFLFFYFTFYFLIIIIIVTIL